MTTRTESIIERLEPRAYLSAGDPIDSFGVGGLVRLPRGMQVVSPTSIQQTSSDKLLIGINGQRGKTAAVTLPADFVRLTLDGRLDPSFGSDGIVDSFFTSVRAVSPLNEDRFMAFGYVEDGDPATPLVWQVARFMADGSLDSSFASDGRVQLSPAALRKFRISDAYFTAAGLLTVSGYRVVGGNFDPQMMRFAADGSLDASFADQGILPLKTPRAWASGGSRAVAFGPDGAIYQLGQIVRNGTTSSTLRFLRKLKPDGTLDASFGEGGYVSIRAGYSFTSVTAIGDALYLTSNRLMRPVAFVTKLNLSGRTDREWGQSGTVEFGYGYFNPIVELPGGEILVGYSRINASGIADRILPAGSSFGIYRAVGRDGVLYAASVSEIYATSLSPDAGTPIATLDANGKVTLNGTRAADHLSVGTSSLTDDSNVHVIARREVWYRAFAPDIVNQVLIEAGSGGDSIGSYTDVPVTVAGGAGDDRINAHSVEAGSLFAGGSGNDTFYIFGEGFAVEGDSGDDSFRLQQQEKTAGQTPAISVAHGGAGNDKMQTSGLRGVAGFMLFGDDGNDYLRSSFTSDTINGGPGRDSLRGGGGIDLFIRDEQDSEG